VPSSCWQLTEEERKYQQIADKIDDRYTGGHLSNRVNPKYYYVKLDYTL